MRPKICHTLRNLNDSDLKNSLFDGYELNFDEGVLKPNIVILMKARELLNDKDLSLHSQLSRIFSANDRGFPEFSEAEMNILKSEIIISEILGVKQINFHMKDSEFSEEEKRRFNEIIDFAEEKGVEMVYENHVCSEEAIMRVLNNFPRVKFCLDIGHLNLAIHKGKFKTDLNEFIEKIKPRLIHLHAHNNYGKEDSHSSLDKGDFPWQKILDKLKDSNLRKIILELNTKEEIKRNKKILEKYYPNN